MSGYEKHVEYHFCLDDENLDDEYFSVVVDTSGDYVFVEELRKNGQEDCHMSGGLLLVDGKFVWDEGKESFVTYGSQRLADAIREYLDENGVPGVGEPTDGVKKAVITISEASDPGSLNINVAFDPEIFANQETPGYVAYALRMLELMEGEQDDE